MQELIKQNYPIWIVPNQHKQKIIKKVTEQGLKNIKIMSLSELCKKFYFDYDDRTIYYLMKHYGYQYDVAKMYLSHLYEVEYKDFGSAKVKKIIDLKQNLKEEHLLIFNHAFKEYLKDKKLLFYNCEPLDGITKKLINDLQKICSFEFYQDKRKEYPHECIYEFDTIEEEVYYIASQISSLVSQDEKISKIKICGATGEYNGLIKRVFDWYHIPISFDDNYLYATKIGQDFLNHLATTPEESLKYIEEHYPLKDNNVLEIYNEIIAILNHYAWAEDLLSIKSFIIDSFKKKKIKIEKYLESVTMIDSLEALAEDDIVFLLGFNQGDIPKTYKDEDYFNDTLKQKLGLDTTNELNKKIYDKWLQNIKQTKNLIITTKKTSSLGVHYLSSLNDELQLEIRHGKIEYNHSHLFNQLMLAEKIDTFVKYGEKKEDLELLYTNYPNLPYGEFISNYRMINKDKLKDYLNHRLILSYSSMNTYYQCGFRYYLANILKLNIFEETFYTILGNLFHYILSIAFTKEISLKEEYQNYLSKCEYPFNSREKFFLNQLEEELEFIITTIKKQNETNSLKKLYLEEQLVVPKDREDMKISFKGFIDKMMVNDKEDIVSIVDYKTGTPDLNLNHIIYGLDLQLPVYVYLARKKFPNASIAGFYLQKILNNEISKDDKHTYTQLKEDKLKLQGYSNSDLSILEQFDSSYYESKVIKGMRTTSKGIASKKVLNDDQINRLEEITEEKIEEAIKGITNACFEINPKRIGMDNLGCKYCSFKDICFLNEGDIQNLKEYKNMEFLGGVDNDTKETY